MAEVVLQNVNKTYPGGVKAVSGFDLTIADGEFVVLVGPSGCGKSTTLRMIAGLEDVTEGTISIGGRVVTDVAPKDRDIAMVFQNYALYPHMTVYENMAFGLKLRRLPKPQIEQRVTEAAEMLGLSGVLKRRPQALSGGQRQRVAVGRAVVREPAVFLFDEPLSNLDAKLRGQMRAEISRLHQRLNTTMVYVTHDQVEAMTMGDRLVLMKDGAIQQVADPGTLYRAPANRFVAGFIGSPPMNFIPGALSWTVGDDGGCRFRAAPDVELPLETCPQAAALRSSAAGGEREVLLGIRPEDIGSLRAEQEAAAPRLRGVIDLLEPLGAETYVHVRIGETTCVSRAEGTRQLRVGEPVELAVYLDHVHLFDAQSGLPVAP